MRSKKQKKSGFTLIELSIVLVIIGLIVGGVLVGRDLIHAAEIRAQASQIESYKTAVNTFILKYNQIPGDMTASSAAAFEFTPREGTANNGDGNGILTNCSGLGGSENVGCEFTLFWNDMSSANLVNGTFNTATNDAITNGQFTATTSQLPLYFPQAKIRDGFYVRASYNPATYRNRFVLSGLSDIVNGTPTDTNNPRSLTPMEAWNLDQKIDDGLPMTGKVWGVNSTVTVAPLPFGTAAACFTDEDTPNTYNVKRSADADVISCNQWYFW
jgi:prepilin-type N-terminal cleavage/methylation domain-containing protein